MCRRRKVRTGSGAIGIRSFRYKLSPAATPQRRGPVATNAIHRCISCTYPGLWVELVISERFVDRREGKPTSRSDSANQGMKPSLPGRSLMRPGLCMPARPIWNGSRPHNVELEPPSCCRLPCCYRELSSRSMAAVARAHATIAARSQHLQDVILELKPAPGLQPDIGADALQPCKCAGPITILSES